MTERAFEDGFVDCPRFGVMDQLRCLPSCEFQDTKDERHVVCHFGEARRADAATNDAAAEPQTEQAGASPG
jgi:hypothetical protein